MVVVPKFERDLIQAAQALTGSWVDLGDEIRTNNLDSFGVFIDLDVNDSQDVRFRALCKHTQNDTDEYFLPIRTITASDVKIQDEYIEFNDDTDQKTIIQVKTDFVVPYVQLQVQAGTVGATPGDITSATLTRSQRAHAGTW